MTARLQIDLCAPCQFFSPLLSAERVKSMLTSNQRSEHSTKRVEIARQTKGEQQAREGNASKGRAAPGRQQPLPPQDSAAGLLLPFGGEGPPPSGK